MPFAGEFREGMRLPRQGDAVDAYVVESVDVKHVGVGPGRYEYPLQIVVRGKGGKDGARRALRDVLGRRATIFSEYGNPYQCGIGSVSVETVSPSVYRVSACGVGTRVHLRQELDRFLEWTIRSGRAADLAGSGQAARAGLAADYMREYAREASFAPPRGP